MSDLVPYRAAQANPAHVLVLAFGEGGVVELLEEHGQRVTVVGDPLPALGAIPIADVVVIDQREGRMDQSVAACTRLRGDPKWNAVPILCIAATTDVEDRVQFLEAGADDVMPRPFDALELDARVDALAARSLRARQPEGDERGGVRRTVESTLICFFGAKGGSGTTTLATNVAMLLAARGDRSVALVDLDLRWGDAAVYLDVPIRNPVTDLARDRDALADPRTIETFPARHENGLAVFGAPARPDDGIEASAVGDVLVALRDAFDIIVVDAGSSYGALAATVLGHADRVVIPVVPAIPALRAVRGLLELLSESDRGRAGTVLVLQHIFARDMLRRGEVESALGQKIDLEMPYDATLYLAAANAGEPIVVSAPNSLPSERMRTLATMVAGEPRDGAALGERRRSLGSLLRRG